MTNEEKELLLKDLCGRLPYNTIIEVIDNRGKEEIRYTTIISCAEIDMFQHDEKMVKPYLRRLSSMTDEEKEELVSKHIKLVFEDKNNNPETVAVDIDGFDWLNANNFDYRGLIDKGLANEGFDYRDLVERGLAVEATR